MRVLIIAYNDDIISQIHNHLRNENIDLRRINLVFTLDNLNINQMGSMVSMIKLTNFHDLTVEIMDFDPQIVLYFPLDVPVELNNILELIEISQVELVEHLSETLQVVNSKFYFVNLLQMDKLPDKLGDRSIDKLQLEIITDKRNQIINSSPKLNWLLPNKSEITFDLLLKTIKAKLKG